MADLQKFKDKFSNLIANSANTVTAKINGVDYTGVKSAFNREIRYSDYARENNLEFSVNIPVDDFEGNIPEPRKDKATISGTEYRILDYEIDSHDANIRLDLTSKWN